MKIPFSPPLINSYVKEEVNDSLDSGWITTGPKVKKLESQIKNLTNAPEVLCVNSWTSGAILILKWLGVEAGDEVIIPAYTYSATALAVIHAGATPVFVDISDDFNISTTEIKKAITAKTKAIIPVDIAGWPCDYTELNSIVETSKKLFTPNGDVQEKLGRIMIISDAAHSIGATYNNLNTGVLADITIFSLHAVKNVTTAEGGAICLNMPSPFNNEELYGVLRCYSLNGQTKDAFSKTKAGAWRYDIIYPGLKINMPDVLAAIGVGQMKTYSKETLPKRVEIFESYNAHFSSKKWAIIPPYKSENKQSSCHIYALRIKNISEAQRDEIINLISEKDIAVNVHFQPLPLLSAFKNMGYKINDFPVAYNQYKNEISLPIYPQLKTEEIEYISKEIVNAIEKVV
ncbi:MAG: DegT/DnrJ/EryC1/StrS family aminotransferase [Cellulophaga sp.]|uniref:DegT/DnrJ/EryC1/StrS family aminotransferase n=1 Tax=unclassified Cellulophaga TaxID=2634405 RepID=UPI0026E30011|nr:MULTISPECIES: DegT/DnrJ/EryC1/StrS family aminotransferase [unclassified Cellulophaga]MDO6491485.1 DegT/DnrJ/EryC1/StrS family aminotransferase [Cellulophaga sp. 2_MG-2023]MDO6493362.1 DegT/DnrJ/EryC1/StrS family aminotransferase [Cellulophaga sp. 3_MG-2023]